MPLAGAGLTGEEVEALLRRYLAGEPGITLMRLKGGLGCLCQGPFGRGPAAPWLFAVGMDGGVLVRLPEEAREKIVDNRVGVANAALPEWVVRLEPADDVAASSAAARDPGVHGAPDEWVWIHLPDGEAFERRKPHVYEALSFCRHQMAGHRR